MLKAILQIVIISAPQIVLGIIFCLLMINKFELINIDEITGTVKFSKIALLKIAIPTIITAFFSITLRHLRFGLWIVPPFLILILFFSMLIVYRIGKLNDAVKLALSICLMTLITAASEAIIAPMIIHIKGITVYDVFDSFYINFMCSIPTLIIYLSINTVLFTKRKNFLNISIFKLIMKSRVLTFGTMLILVENIIMMIIYSIIVNDKVLEVYNTNLQILIDAILMTFPAINLVGIWFLLYSVKYKEALDMRVQRDRIIKEVSIAKERSRMAREIHDALGHSLTVIIKLLEVCKISSNSDKINEQLEEAIRIAQNGVQEVKHSVSSILEDKILNQDLFSSLMELACEFENNSGIKVDVTTQGIIEDVSKKHAMVLYSVCKDALSNSLRHGKARNIGIVMNFKSKAIKLSIFDDGVGCRKINKGHGIKGMEQRIIDVNGKMDYKSGKGQGFILNFEIPKEEVGMLA